MHSILVLVLVVVLSVSRLVLVVLPKYGLALEVLRYCKYYDVKVKHSEPSLCP
jgi:hypothetical protein